MTTQQINTQHKIVECMDKLSKIVSKEKQLEMVYQWVRQNYIDCNAFQKLIAFIEL